MKLFRPVMAVPSNDKCIFFFTSYNRYNNDSVNINSDTAYIYWTNTFPAISTCVARGSRMNRIQTIVKAYLLATNETMPKKSDLFSTCGRLDSFSNLLFISQRVHVL